MRLLYLLLVLMPMVNCDKIVNTNNGPIRGSSVPGKKIDAFLGIPFAEPPLGALRFARPVPKRPWKDTYEANQLPPNCIQAKLGAFHMDIGSGSKMSEDCLFLNLWVPSEGRKKPIIVFIHGGAYMVGSSNWSIYNGALLAERGDVIVATINYRLGTLGFFTALTDDAGGNMAMYDQVMALQWIKANAEHFGGDPDNIILIGESAGSFSVSMHMISPLSQNLFKRSILHSGTAFSPMYSDDNEHLLMGCQIVANLSGCADENNSLKNNPKAVVDCLKSLPAEKISEVDLQLFRTFGFLTPRVGDDFLPVNPIDLYRDGKFKKDDVLIGVNRDEGSYLLTLLKPDKYGVYGEKVNPRTFSEATAKEEMRSFLPMSNEEESNKIIENYLRRVNETARYSYLEAVSDLLGDYLITCGAVFQADYQSLKDVPVYFYRFEYRPPASSLAEWMGVAHFDEMQYLFGVPGYDNFTHFEEDLSKDIMDMWVAFARTGNPNIGGGVKWPRYTVDDPKCFVISRKDSLGEKPDSNRCKVMRNLFRVNVS